MTSKLTIAIAAGALLTAVTGMPFVQAQGAALGAGIYTEEQAKRGMSLYKEQCASCHGEDLKGNEIIPGLAGEMFMNTWQGRSLGDLFEKIADTMPALNPGSLTPEQTADLIAHMLSVSKYPAGKTALASGKDALQQIKIDK